jgi:hypothetical protein
MMGLVNPHNTAAHIINQKECGAHQAATTFPDKEGTKDTPHHHCMTYTKRKALITSTHTDALMPDKHTIEPRLTSDNTPKHHFGGNIGCPICNNRITTINKNPQSQAHLYIQDESDPHMHTHGQHHLPQKNINTPPIP